LKRWLSVLRDAGKIEPQALPPITPQDQIFAGFSDYLQRERGLAPGTIIKHLRFCPGFLPLLSRILRGSCSAGEAATN
jgi:hypothetical protein